MICPNCQTPNLEDANFCSNCGQALANICPNCGAENLQGAKFCSNCGEQLIAESTGKEEKLIQYVPEELLKKFEAIRSGRKMAGERRVVTILFCDVKGSTAAAEQLDPEDWVEIMNETFTYLIEPVYRYEGMLARLMGDAVLAFFGAPIAHENDAERALLAGLGIIRGIEPYRKQVNESRGLDFNVRVGINTGLVVVGEVGSDLRLEYTAMGDAVNLAARMEQTAEPGTVQVAHETYQRVEPLFEFEPLGEIDVKGKQDPVLAYRALGRKAHPRRMRGIQGLEAPLVGRAQEMEVLQQAFQELQRGYGGIVCLIGEAGLGKSRMIDELQSSFEHQDYYWAQSHGLSYDTDRPYGQFKQQIRHLWGGEEADDAELLHSKLESVLTDLPPNERDPASLALEALFWTSSGPSTSSLEGEALKRQLFAANLAIWKSKMDGVSTVLVFDDLHWADSASTELLTYLFQLTDSGPILFLCAFRPDRSAPSWQVKQAAETEYPHRYKEVELRPLTDQSSKELVDELLTISELPPKLHELIQERAEGNPFFVEEVIRTLIDEGAVVREKEGARWTAGAEIDALVIPDNLQSLLISRMDRLEEDVRRTLQLASVIGRNFYYRVLKDISEAADGLDRRLSALQRVELIFEAARDPELEYAFRHALAQEAAYRSILRKERRAYHIQVGETLEQLYPGREAEFAPLLAHHFLEAGDDRGPKYAVLAGDEAFRLYALQDAIRHYRHALQAQESSSLGHVYTRLGRSYELLDRFEDALLLYKEMRADAQSRSDGEMELISLTEIAKIRSTLNPMYDPDKGRMLSDEALALARELENREAEARILWNRSNAETYGGENSHAIEFGKRSLEIAEQYNLREQMAFTLNDLTRTLLMGGETQQAIEMNLRAREIWLELENLPMLGDNYAAGAMVKSWLGRYDEAIEEAERSYQITKSIDNTWGQASSCLWLGLTYLDQGRFELAIETLIDGMQLALDANAKLAVMLSGSFLGMAYGNLGRMELAFAALEEGTNVDHTQFAHLWPYAVSSLSRLHLLQGDLREARRLSQASYHGLRPIGSVSAVDYVLITDADVALAEDEAERAVELMDELLRLAEQAQRRTAVSQALLVQGRGFRALGNHDAARACLSRALKEAKELGTKRVAWQILLELSRLEAGAGNNAEAGIFHTQAAAAVSELAESIADAELRESFENLPDVREALSA